jgi:hypothetical protein
MTEVAALYLDDLFGGQRFTSGTYLMNQAWIKGFAVEFDLQPFLTKLPRRRASLKVWRRAVGTRLPWRCGFWLQVVCHLRTGSWLGWRNQLASADAPRRSSARREQNRRNHTFAIQTAAGSRDGLKHDAESERGSGFPFQREGSGMETSLVIVSAPSKEMEHARRSGTSQLG